MKDINPDMIVLARESRGLTQKELSEKIDIRQGTLSKIEQGFQSITEEIIQKLSFNLHFPVEFFLQDDQILNPIMLFYRKRVTIPKKVVAQIESNMNITRINIETMLRSIDIPPPNIIQWDVDEDGSPEKAAQFQREHWGLAKGRIDNLTELIENNGFGGSIYFLFNRLLLLYLKSLTFSVNS